MASFTSLTATICISHPMDTDDKAVARCHADLHAYQIQNKQIMLSTHCNLRIDKWHILLYSYCHLHAWCILCVYHTNVSICIQSMERCRLHLALLKQAALMSQTKLNASLPRCYADHCHRHTDKLGIVPSDAVSFSRRNCCSVTGFAYVWIITWIRSSCGHRLCYCCSATVVLFQVLCVICLDWREVWLGPARAALSA